MGIRTRFAATVLLVLAVLGGAGLAVAADRYQDPGTNPGLTWAADHGARPWLTLLAADLGAVSVASADLDHAARDTAGSLQSLNLAAMGAAVTDGDSSANVVGGALHKLNDDYVLANADIDRAHLSPTTAAQLDAIDAAVSAAPKLSSDWTLIKARATDLAALVAALLHHDELVVAATTAGRRGDWAAALSSLSEATTALDDARRERDAMGIKVGTLDELITRYDTYDSALSGLYAYLLDGVAGSGPTFAALSTTVEVAQAALPGDSGVYSLIVGESGTGMTDALFGLERARDDIDTALADLQ